MPLSHARWFRTSTRDAAVLATAVGHGALFATVLAGAAGGATGGVVSHAAAIFVLGAAMNWGSNTVSHIHLHTPLFRRDGANRIFSLYLSVLLGVPQAWWKARHLDHHALPEARWPSPRATLRRQGWAEMIALSAAWVALAAAAPLVFATVYLPAMLLGLGLCAVQGREEHVGSPSGVDVRARLYNRLWFNDGLHAAHHRRPDAHWTTLPACAAAGDLISGLPPTLRWLERAPAFANRAAALVIDLLERATLSLRPVRWFLLTTHGRAWARVLRTLPASGGDLRSVTVVGGGLFPRTALILARLLPGARLTIVESVPEHVACAARFLAGTPASDATVVLGRLGDDLGAWRAAINSDLLVLPLAFRGERERFYRRPPTGLVAIHDWMWRVRGLRGTRVSFLLLKRLNIVERAVDRSVEPLARQGSQVGAVQVHAAGGDGSDEQPPSAAGTSRMS